MNATVTPSNLMCLNQMTRAEQKPAARVSPMRVDGKTSCSRVPKKSLPLRRGSREVGIKLKYGIREYCLGYVLLPVFKDYGKHN